MLPSPVSQQRDSARTLQSGLLSEIGAALSANRRQRSGQSNGVDRAVGAAIARCRRDEKSPTARHSGRPFMPLVDVVRGRAVANPTPADVWRLEAADGRGRT